MELNYNSWYVSLYNYTYPASLPNNLCSLFWGLVLASVLFILNVILRITIHILNLFIKDKFGKSDNRTLIGFAMYVVFAGIIATLYGAYNSLLLVLGSSNYDKMAIACFVIIITCGTGLYLMSKETKPKPKTLKNNIIINYAKAWYNKNCPRINWK